MGRKLVRPLVTLATFVALWLVAPSALAKSSLSSVMSVSLGLSEETTAPVSRAEADPLDPLASEEAPPPAPAIPRNAAPLCDPRGATMFAPPPQLQDVEQSLEVSRDCARDDGLRTLRDGHQVERHRAPSPGSSETTSHEPTLGSSLLLIGRGEGVRVPAPDADRQRSRPGHRTLPERPPRA
jgi:hypothetical protein